MPCWWEKLKAQTCIFWLRISFLPFLQPLIFRFRIHGCTSRPTTTMKHANQNLLTYLFHLFPFPSYLNVKQYLTLYLNFLRRKNILRSLEILGRENLDLSLKWALDNRKRFRIITELILSFDINRLKIYLFFSEHRKEQWKRKRSIIKDTNEFLYPIIIR